jgi:hypothetical protein
MTILLGASWTSTRPSLNTLASATNAKLGADVATTEPRRWIGGPGDPGGNCARTTPLVPTPNNTTDTSSRRERLPGERGDALTSGITELMEGRLLSSWHCRFSAPSANEMYNLGSRADGGVAHLEKRRFT